MVLEGNYIGQIIRPKKGVIYSNDYNISHIKSAEVTSLNHEKMMQIKILSGEIYKYGYVVNNKDLVVAVFRKHFEELKTDGLWEINF